MRILPQALEKKHLATLVVLGVFAAGVAAVAATKLIKSIHLEYCHSRYNLLNPNRRCNDDMMPLKREYEAFAEELESWVQEQIDKGMITHAAVYFRDLENGPWFGINEEATFAPASLLKVPTMLAALKIAESDPAFLAQELAYSGQLAGVMNQTDDTHTIKPGVYYPVLELIRRMIVYSDNASKDLLVARLEALSPDRNPIEQTYRDLGIFGFDSDLDDFITVKTYASIFRTLYNSSYLTPEYSQLALELLSQSDFIEGIVAGVPRGTKVAHKFGVRDQGDGLEQLHDCGIVYHPETPYLLCIMTRGPDKYKNALLIREIAAAIHAEVDGRSQLLGKRP